jgi:hypothetical protein
MQRIERLETRQRGGSRRGSIVAYMLVILLVLVTGVVMTTATAAAVQAQMSSLQTRRDQAYYAAEAGIQRAFYEVEYGSWQTTTTYPQLTGIVGNSSYSVTATGSGWNSAVVVKSVGSLSTDTSVNCAITVTFVPKTLVPAINLGAGISENGNLTVDGNAMVKADIKLGGLVAIDGTLIFGGANKGKANGHFQWADPDTIPVPPSVWYDPTGTLTPPTNVINVSPMIAAGSGAKALASNSPATLDFRTASNGVLYYFGDVDLKNVTVYGSGSLVVFGNITVQNGGFGDSLDPVNLVATGDIATQAKFRIYGSLYANGDITHQGQFDVTGTVNAQGSMFPTTGNGGAGGATINRAPTPPFDPRVTAGSGSIVFSNFSGPSF